MVGRLPHTRDIWLTRLRQQTRASSSSKLNKTSVLLSPRYGRLASQRSDQTSSIQISGLVKACRPGAAPSPRACTDLAGKFCYTTAGMPTGDTASRGHAGYEGQRVAGPPKHLADLRFVQPVGLFEPHQALDGGFTLGA